MAQGHVGHPQAKLIRSFVELAKYDLESANILYGKKKYLTSFILFQQSIEKANKACALMSELAELNELKKIGHNTLGIYKQFALTKEKDVQKTVDLIRTHPNWQNNPFNMQKKIAEYQQGLSKNIKGFDALTSQNYYSTSIHIRLFIREAKQLEKLSLRINEKKVSFLMTGFSEISEFIEGFNTPKTSEAASQIRNLFSNKETLIELYRKIIFPMFIDLNFMGTVFFGCALIVHPYKQVRYPEKDLNPVQFYNYKLPAIRMQPSLTLILNKALTKLSDLSRAL